MDDPLCFQFFVTDAVWTGIAGAFFPVFFVFGITAFEKYNLRIAFKSENMGSNAIKKPAVVRNNYRAAGKVFKTFFERSQGVNVNIVGWLIEQQYIGLRTQGKRQVHTVPFTT